jgi:hypothetical protein
MSIVAAPLGESSGIGPTGLRLRPGIEFEEWVKIGRQVANLQNATSWALGDWFFYGEWEYGSRYETAVAATGLAYQTLADLKYVAGRYEFSRRREGLSVSHHRELASLPLPEQDRWLDLTERERWSREQLRHALAGTKTSAELADERQQPPITATQPAGEPVAIAQPALVQLVLVVDVDQLALWRSAAASARLSVEEWVRHACDQAA